MRFPRLSVALATVSILVSPAIAQTFRDDRPIRGAWLRPTPTVNQLNPVFANLADAGITDLFLETFYHGVSTGRQGVFNARFGFDYLRQAIFLAARYNLRTHAWLESGYWQFGTTGEYNFTDNPEWRVISRATGQTGGDQAGQVFANLIHPGVQQKLRDYCAELADYPGLWGIQTDYHRYPLDDNTGDAFPAPWSYDPWTRAAFQAQHGADPWTAADTTADALWNTFLAFRRNGISQAANQMNLGIRAVEPDLTFSAAMFARAMLDNSQRTKCQDWPAWAANGYVDWLVPMAYASSASGITSDINVTRASAAGRRVVAGLAIIAGDRPSITAQLNAIRAASVEDFILFEATILADAAKRAELRAWTSAVARQRRADFNNDQTLDARDFTLFRAVYAGTPVPADGPNARFDLNADSLIDHLDENLLKRAIIQDRFGDDARLSTRDRAAFEAAIGAVGAAGTTHLYDLNADGVVNAADRDLLNLLDTPARPPCPADFNDDGFVDFFDLDAFVLCFEGDACPADRDADFNADGFIDFFDLDAFVTAFEDGC